MTRRLLLIDITIYLCIVVVLKTASSRMTSSLLVAGRLSSTLRLSVSLNAKRISRRYVIPSASRITESLFAAPCSKQKEALCLSPHRVVDPQKVQQRFYSVTSMLAKEYPEHTIFPMPALSPTMESGTIASWALKEGDEFSAGDVLCSIETDKASVDFEAQDDGILAKILKEGKNAEDVPIGEPICVVVEEADDVAAFADFEAAVAPSPATPSIASGTNETPVSSPEASVVATSSESSPLMPAARHLSQSKGLDATVLQGTGKGGRVTKGDVLKAIAEGVKMPALQKSALSTPLPSPDAAASVPAPAAPALAGATLVDLPLIEVDNQGAFEDVANNKMRKVIASRLTDSKRSVPHFYSSVEVELDNVMKLRKQLMNDHEVKVSVNDLIIRCCALALRDVPEVNATYDPKSGEVQLHSSIDISVAVATPTGLITPIVPNTDKLGLSEITETVRDLAGRARDGKLQPQEYQGGTFAVSNLGMFGIDEFSAVINPPQAAILAVGGGSKRIVPTPYVDGAEVQPKPSIKTIMTGRLSADRRVVDEATASLFLSAFQHYISKPELLML